VDVKDELKNTAIQITCLDEDGNVLKRVTSGDSGDIEEDNSLTPGSLTPDPSLGGEGSDNTGGSNTGGNEGDDNTGGDNGGGGDDNGGLSMD
jgi:hypothetical protein